MPFIKGRVTVIVYAADKGSLLCDFIIRVCICMDQCMNEERDTIQTFVINVAVNKTLYGSNDTNSIDHSFLGLHIQRRCLK